MPAICVAGNVGLDRIWYLDSTLRPGARISCAGQVCRLGGGAANTATALRALGHDARIVARLRRDATGERLLEMLRRGGLDGAGIERIDGLTMPGEIFVQPDGERTLISKAGKAAGVPSTLGHDDAPYTYFNISRLSNPLVLAPLLDRTILIAQLPLDPDEPRPAHVLIASRSDVGEISSTELWRRRRAVDGMALRHLVITDGARGSELVGADGACHVPATPILELRDSIGAGDFFAAGLIDGLARGCSAHDATAHAQSVAKTFLMDRPTILAEPIAFSGDSRLS
jgi:sugar/nucleoside kinase (ribokinase family)